MPATALAAGGGPGGGNSGGGNSGGGDSCPRAVYEGVYTVKHLSHTLRPETCQTTVCWEVFSGTHFAISHFLMNGPVGCAVAVSATVNGTSVPVQFKQSNEPCDLPGIKFADGFADCQAKTVCVTYDGMFPMSDENNTSFVIKAGNQNTGGCLAPIMAPGIDCSEPATCKGGGCGDGQWTCQGGHGVCDGEGELNRCGGCDLDLDATWGDDCGTTGCKRSTWQCDPADHNKLVCTESPFECDWFDAGCATYTCVENSCNPTLHHDWCNGFDNDLCDGGPQCGTDGQCEDAPPVTCQDDALFCNGAPTCDAGNGKCDAGESPCTSAKPWCDEETDHCYECTNFGDNVCGGCIPFTGNIGGPCGNDPCNPGKYECGSDEEVHCVTTPKVCPSGQFCDDGSCIECLGDSDCDGVCIGHVCYECDDAGDCDDDDDCTVEACTNHACDHTPNAACDAQCIDFGALSKLNLLVCGDYLMGQAGDVEGAAGIKGSIWAGDFGIGNTLHQLAGIRDALIVGDTYHFTSGQVYGNAYYGKAEDVTGQTGFLGTRKQGAPKDFSFDALCNGAMATSQKLSELAANGTVTNSYGRLDFVGTDAKVNVINVSGALVSVAHTFHVKAPVGSVVIINVSGASVDFKNAGMTTEGVGASGIVWNLFEATTLKITGITVKGAVLAPKADTSFTNGNIDGATIVKRLTGNGEFHHMLFDGEVCPPDDAGGVDPTPPPAPEPPPAPAPPPPPPAPVGCGATASFEVYNHWWGEFQARVKLSNLKSGVSGWTVAFDLGPTPAWIGGWWASYQTSGATVTARDVGWNGTVGPGGTIEFHIQAPKVNQQLPTASNFKLNGVACGN